MMSIIVSWRDRKELEKVLPQLVVTARLLGGDITIVNFSGSGKLLSSQLGDVPEFVSIVEVAGQKYFNKAAAQNVGAACCKQPILFFCDCDIIVTPNTIVALAQRVFEEKGVFATLASVTESEINARKAGHVVCFGYELFLRTADGRRLAIKDNEEDGATGKRQAPGLLLVRRDDFLAINGYNAHLHGWGWEDQDMIARLTLGLGLTRITEGDAIHVSHDDVARIAAYPRVSSRWESRDAMFRKALANYDDGNFRGTYDHDSKALPMTVHNTSEHRSERIVVSTTTSNEPLLSACLIVRDEAKVLERCLRSIVPICDELCIVDTGSTDNTLKIAKAFGAKTRRFTSCNGPDGRIMDFACARNAALEMATARWILQIDADEVLQLGAADIRPILLSEQFDRIGVMVASEGVEWVSGRLFRRSKSTQYRNRVHEYIECSGTFSSFKGIKIENISDKTNKESSADRNIRLCLLAIAENPTDARNHHFLGNEYREKGLLKEAIESYQNALRLGNYGLGKFHSAYYLAVCFLLQENWDAAIIAGLEAVKIDPRYAEGHCFMGDVYSCLGNISYAQIWYKNALHCNPPPIDAVFPIQMWAYSEHPLKRLAILDGIADGSDTKRDEFTFKEQ